MKISGNPTPDLDTPTVFIVDDDPGLCRALACLLESIHLPCETYSSARQFLCAYDPRRPGCLVLDVRMPDMSGLDFQAELTARGYTIPVIIITGYADVPTAVRALKAGAVEFIEKPFSDQAIVECIQKAIERDRQIRLLENERADFSKRLARLTRRERQVMDLLLAGKANKDIATELRLARKTIETHRANLMAKMGTKTLAELIKRHLRLNELGVAVSAQNRQST